MRSGCSLLGVAVGVCQALFNSLSRITVRALRWDARLHSGGRPRASQLCTRAVLFGLLWAGAAQLPSRTQPVNASLQPTGR